jgi:hypothetical protein
MFGGELNEYTPVYFPVAFYAAILFCLWAVAGSLVWFNRDEDEREGDPPWAWGLAWLGCTLALGPFASTLFLLLPWGVRVGTLLGRGPRGGLATIHRVTLVALLALVPLTYLRLRLQWGGGVLNLFQELEPGLWRSGFFVAWVEVFALCGWLWARRRLPSEGEAPGVRSGIYREGFEP